MNIEQEQVIDSESLRFESVEIVRENAEPDTLSPLCRLQKRLGVGRPSCLSRLVSHLFPLT